MVPQSEWSNCRVWTRRLLGKKRRQEIGTRNSDVAGPNSRVLNESTPTWKRYGPTANSRIRQAGERAGSGWIPEGAVLTAGRNEISNNGRGSRQPYGCLRTTPNYRAAFITNTETATTCWSAEQGRRDWCRHFAADADSAVAVAWTDCVAHECPGCGTLPTAAWPRTAASTPSPPEQSALNIGQLTGSGPHAGVSILAPTRT